MYRLSSILAVLESAHNDTRVLLLGGFRRLAVVWISGIMFAAAWFGTVAKARAEVMESFDGSSLVAKVS